MCQKAGWIGDPVLCLFMIWHFCHFCHLISWTVVIHWSFTVQFFISKIKYRHKRNSKIDASVFRHVCYNLLLCIHSFKWIPEYLFSLLRISSKNKGLWTSARHIHVWFVCCPFLIGNKTVLATAFLHFLQLHLVLKLVKAKASTFSALVWNPVGCWGPQLSVGFHLW